MADTDGDQPAFWLRHCLEQAAAHVDVRTGDRFACYVGACIDGLQSSEEAVVVRTAARGVAARLAVPDVEKETDRLATLLRGRYPHAAANPVAALPIRILRDAARDLLPGPCESVIVDAACASSLYALDLAVRSVLSGDCAVAFCGGLFALGPRWNVLFSKLHGLSRTGSLRPFDASADGTVFADGAAIIAVETLQRAIDNGHPVLGVLAGVGLSADGSGKAVYAPNPAGQRLCLQRARRNAGIDAGDVDWIVAHATGTPAGDAAELSVLADLAPDQGYPCTSTKSIVGHSGWTAGAVSVIHALLAMRHGTIPPQRLVDFIGSDGSRARVPLEPVELRPTAGRPVTVGVSAFGFGGANAHAVLQNHAGQVPHTAEREAVPPDPLVLVGWSAVLPGDPSRASIIGALRCGVDPSHGRRFDDSLTPPSFAESRLPPDELRAIDRGQWLALRAAARFARDYGELWDPVRETTAVLAVQLGPARLSMDNLVRCYAPDLAQAFVGADAAAFQRYLADLRHSTPPSTAATLPGVLPNVLAGRVSNRYNLRGPAFLVDTGDDSGSTAIQIACDYLAAREIELALVLGVSANSRAELADLLSVDPRRIAEGAFLLAVSRRSTAQQHRWPTIAELEPSPSADPAGRLAHAIDDGTTYLGADGLAALLRAAHGVSSTVVELASDEKLPRHAIRVSPVGVTPNRTVASRQRTQPFGRGTRQLGSLPPATAAHAIPENSLVLVDSPEVAESLAKYLPNSARLVVADPTADVHTALSSVFDSNVQHVRVVAALPETGWPSAPSSQTQCLHDLTFLAAARLSDTLRHRGTFAILLLDPLRGGRPHPHGSLFTGLAKALSWEWDARICVVVTNTLTLASALCELASELQAPHRLPVVQVRSRCREAEVYYPLATSPLAETALHDGSVVVAVGGARGITAAVLLALAQQCRPRIWLLGTSELVGQGGSRGATTLAEILAAHPGIGVSAAARLLSAERRAAEVADTVARLRALCGTDRVEYLRCDVTAPDATAAAANRIYAADGAVDLLIHAAGLTRTGMARGKSLADFRLVRDCKLLGYHNLKQAFATPPPRLWCNFGSVIGTIGVAGETDYAAANEFLTAAAEYSSLMREHTSETTLVWPAWSETGLAADRLSTLTRDRQGVFGSIDSREGAAHALAQLMRSPFDTPVVAWLGDREIQSFTAHVPGIIRIPNPPDTDCSYD